MFRLGIVSIILAGCVGFAGALASDAIVPMNGSQTLPDSFSADDNALLNEIEHACFLFFWHEVGSPAGLAKDRMLAPVASIASVGFQLSALPIGVERGWITREEGKERAETVLSSLLSRDDNKKNGVYLHYVDYDTAGFSKSGYEVVAGTVDHALLLAGAIPAAEYFGDDLAKMVDRLVAETNWKAYVAPSSGFLSMGWKPDDTSGVAGPGRLLEAEWRIASGEERLTYFMAATATDNHAIDPALYYRLERHVKRHKKMAPFAVSWSGTLFNYLFSHCWIDYRALGTDDPGKFGVDAPRIDWFENSRRAVETHRQRCLEEAGRYKTLSRDRWGLSACAAKEGYIVQHMQPNLTNADVWCDGTIAPYAAGSAIMFTPKESLVALRAFRNLKNEFGFPVAWQAPDRGGYGLVDAFNLDQKWASDDFVGIDQGPMLLAIENARTGLIWRLFMRHTAVERAIRRLKMRLPDVK